MTKISAVVPDVLAGILEQQARAEDRSVSARSRRGCLGTASYRVDPAELGSSRASRTTGSTTGDPNLNKQAMWMNPDVRLAGRPRFSRSDRAGLR